MCKIRGLKSGRVSVAVLFSGQDFCFVFRDLFHCYSHEMNIFVHHSYVNSWTHHSPDNRFIESLNDKPVNGHKHSVHKYSSHENSSEIDNEKQIKSRVQKKRTSMEIRPNFSPLILHMKLERNGKLKVLFFVAILNTKCSND